jgi:glycerol kinase
VETRSGLVVAATLGDQGAGALGVLSEEEDAALVNLGSGGFVLRLTGHAMEPLAGYLSGPLAGYAARIVYALEGTINGGGAAEDRLGAGPALLSVDDPAPGAFCVPDSACIGSPHWRPELSFLLSPPARRLRFSDLRQVVLEGLVFRVREILEDLRPSGSPRRILVSGGLAREPFIGRALAACLGRPVEVVEETEAALVGAARLAAGLSPYAEPATRTVVPGSGGAYLPSKYHSWKAWLEAELGWKPNWGEARGGRGARRMVCMTIRCDGRDIILSSKAEHRTRSGAQRGEGRPGRAIRSQ